MPIRITGSQTIVPGEILAAVVGDPATTSTVNVSSSFANFLNTISFKADRRAAIISAYFWAEKTTSTSDQELVVRLTESGNVVANSARRFHIFTQPASAQMVLCQWSVELTDGNNYSFRPQVAKGSNSETINIRAGGEYPMYLFQAIGL
jgi:hypothetical protein